MDQRRKRLAVRWAFAVFALALAVRLVWVDAVESPYDNLWSDMGGYIRRALELAYGQGDEPREFDTLYPPGTHYIYAAEIALLGWKNHPLLLLINCVWGAAVAPCAMLLAERFVPRLWIAVVLGVAVALWHPLITFSGYFLSEQLYAGLLALSAWLLVRQVETGRSAIMLGVTTALAYLVRPPVLLTVLGLGAVGVYLVVRRPAGAPLLRPRQLARALAIFAAAVVFGAMRYHNLSDRYGLISDNSAMQRLFADTDYGKVRSSDKGYFFAPTSKVQTGETRELSFPGYVGNPAPIEAARRAEVARMAFGVRVRRALTNMSQLFVRNDLWPEGTHLGKGWRRAAYDASRFVLLALVCPLALLGLVSTARRPRTALVVAAAHVLTALTSAAFFCGELRYRVPYDAFLMVLAVEGILFAVAGVRALAQRFRAQPVKQPAPA
jgi:hypothetical protein